MLYLVSTPIGNLGDLTYRAVEVLRSVDVIFAEDTRRTGVLLRHYGVEGRLISAHEHNEAARARLVVEMMGEGKSVALVTDAGTPLLSDPGARLVAAVVEAGYPVVPVPGASALLAALVASGLSAERFTFYGFIPRKGGDRAKLLADIAASPYTSVLYESPQRTAALLDDLRDAAGGDRPVAIARELTKVHEEIYRAPLAEAAERFAEREPRGEIVVVLGGNPAPPTPADEAQASARTLAEALLAQGLPPSAVAKELRQRLDIARNEAYELVQELADSD
ncbi:MAG TPA: 16S rRNA (cytidine(1402)-2'-O)-methyltransferase [Longimicrobiaceae bacterium]|nr:16S rRNA (cytidine(1402)-2'-O)-methyltransferase [Longimicrobiaceae bacterium]